MELNNSCPYRGLQPYTEQDREYFFGREADKEVVASNLLVAPLTILYGSSGVGKSSVLQAGAIPTLRENPKCIIVLFGQWQAESFESALKEKVLAAIAASVGKTEQEALTAIVAEIRRPAISKLDDLGFDVLVTVGAQIFKRRILIIFDQFEEYFLYHLPTRSSEGFDAEFARAINQRESGVNFMIAMREEELSKLDRFKTRIPNLLSNLLRLDNLNDEAARSAIQKPLAVYNKKHPSAPPMVAEPALVDEVIRQVQPRAFAATEDGSTLPSAMLQAATKIETPFLQMVLVKLWEEETSHGSSTLRLETFERLGGSKQIARAHLDKVMAQLTDEQRAVAASVLRFLVTPRGSKIALDATTLAGFANQLEADVEDVLVLLSSGRDMRILRKVTVPGHVEKYELFHDVLGPAILDWRSRYVQEQKLIEERATAEQAFQQKLIDEQAKVKSTYAAERQRRQRQALVVLVGLVLVMFGLSVWAVAQTISSNKHRVEAVNERIKAETERSNAEKQRAYAEEQRGDAQTQYRRAKEALGEAESARKELENQKRAVESERDKTKQQAQLLAVSEGKARKSESEAIDERNKAKQSAEELRDAVNTMDKDLFGLDALRAGNADEAITQFTSALALSQKRNVQSLINYNLLNIGDAYAAKSGVLQAEAMRAVDTLTSNSEKTSADEMFEVYAQNLGPLTNEQNATRQQAVELYGKAIDAARQSQPGYLAPLHQRLGDLYFTDQVQAAFSDDGERTQPDFGKAITSYNEASKIYREQNRFEEEALLESRVGFFQSLVNAGNEQSIQSYEAARTAYARAIDNTKDPLRRSQLETKRAGVIVMLGNSYKPAGPQDPVRMKKAIEYYDEAAQVYVKLKRPDEAAEMFSSIGDFYSQTHDLDQAITNYDNARKYYREAAATTPDEKKRSSAAYKSAEMIKKIASLYKNQPDAQAKTSSYFDRVISEYGSDEEGKAAALQAMGEIVRVDSAQKSKAVEYFKAESEAWRRAGKPFAAANALLRTAAANADNPDKSKLVEMLDHSLDDYTAIAGENLKENRALLVSDLISLANLYSAQGVKISAMKTLNLALVKSLPIAGEPTPPYDYRVSEVIQNGSKILLELRDEEEADNFFKNVFSYTQLNEASASRAPAFEAAASYYARANSPTKAIGYYNQAFDIYHKTNSYLQYDAIRKLGSVHQSVGGPKAAGDYFAQVLPVFSSSSERSSALNAIAQFYNEAKDSQQAISYYEKALEAARVDPKDVTRQSSILRALSTVYRNIGDKQRADELLRQAEALPKR